MIRRTGLLAAAACLLAANPAVAEPIPVDQAVTELNALCVTSRDAFEQGGTVRLRVKPAGRVVQEQRYDPVSGRVLDTGWPSLVQRGVGTFDRSGFVLDARLRKSQVKQAADYLGFAKRPWVLSRAQYGVIASRAFDKYLRIDLLAPDRFVDLDSTLVPSQPQRCADHLLAADAAASVDRAVAGDVQTWSLAYRIDDGSLPVKVTSTLEVRGGLLSSGSAELVGPRRANVDVSNYAEWTYGRPDIGKPAKPSVVSQAAWIRATDAVALVTDIRFLAGSLEGRRTLDGLRRQARARVKAANRGHEIAIQVRDTDGGVLLWARNPYTKQLVAFEVVLEPVPTAVSRRVR